MITILLNDKALTLNASCSLTSALKTYGHTEGHFAVAVNQTFIPKTRYADTVLQDGDIVEILAPQQGG